VNGPEAVQGCYCGRWVPWLWFVDRGCKDCDSRIMRAGATARGSSGCQGSDPWIMWVPGLRFVDHVGRGYGLWIKRVPGLRSADHEDLSAGDAKSGWRGNCASSRIRFSVLITACHLSFLM
jgi:hypothetical protein